MAVEMVRPGFGRNWGTSRFVVGCVHHRKYIFACITPSFMGTNAMAIAQSRSVVSPYYSLQRPYLRLGIGNLRDVGSIIGDYADLSAKLVFAVDAVEVATIDVQV